MNYSTLERKLKYEARYPELIKFLHAIGQTDERSLDITSEVQLDLNRSAALKLLKELGEL
jgi:hypothetical protein